MRSKVWIILYSANHTVYCVGWNSFYLVYPVEQQKLNQTTPYGAVWLSFWCSTRPSADALKKSVSIRWFSGPLSGSSWMHRQCMPECTNDDVITNYSLYTSAEGLVEYQKHIQRAHVRRLVVFQRCNKWQSGGGSPPLILR